jgi:transcriptional regulator with XRE-family HTH domain
MEATLTCAAGGASGGRMCRVSCMRRSDVAQMRASSITYACVMSDAESALTFADLIRTGRQRRGWSQEDLERESGVSRSTLSRWERGLADRPEPEHVRAVCRALGIDPRRAAVALGYLTAEDLSGPAASRPLPVEVAEVLAMLEDPKLPADDRAKWIDYLKFLYQRAYDQAM